MNNKLCIFGIFACLFFVAVSLPTILSVEAASTEICMYASSAFASSENSAGSLASYAIGAPDAPLPGCTQWSGYGYSWSPTAWNIKANLTLTYNTSLVVKNITFIGDYDPCWDYVWLKNSSSGATLQVFSGPSNSCNLMVNPTINFSADTVIMETCGWAWTSTDAVQLCGFVGNGSDNSTNDTNVTANLSIEVCPWKGCKKGAVSVSVDDFFTSCSSQLESKGYRGTYFLTNTGNYTLQQWTAYKNLYLKGHELGTHTRRHFCSNVSTVEFIKDMQNNIDDIYLKAFVKKSDIISHAYPCGYMNSEMVKELKARWNFLSARGYYFNLAESSTPADFFNLKSLNSHGYPGGAWEPPNYFTTVDNAERDGKWVNLVFHVECSDDGVINYLPQKNLWVDTIGNVVKYIKARDNAAISNTSNTTTSISFDVKPINMALTYSQNLSMRVGVSWTPLNVYVSGSPVSFQYISATKQVLFSIPAAQNSAVVITK